ncbi:thioredoxin-like protein AAED1 [Chaetomidium leptoderma]|uniref:Thioredoxin-like protein AAED1 n=1 Tax=Chaetomidium leptoderma TaxID=669021 RepID=A0AAN6ZT67_9PEZI|nr:thioredoxin-like protein AAED1 [Chaetomidium leptoderma]
MTPEAVPGTAAPKNAVDLVAKPAPEAAPAIAEGQSSTPPPATTASAAANIENTGVTGADGINPLDFDGEIDTNHDLPSPETIRKIDNYVVLDRDGKSHTFRSLYTGRHAARRVMIIFIRHFYCGNCQEYLRALTESITPSALLALPSPTFLCIIGCGDPALIDSYTADAGACPFPIYTDPTRKLYAELGLQRTLALGPRPAYTKQHLLRTSLQGVVQGLKQIKAGLALKSGDGKQNGGEFLFEPVDDAAGGGAPMTPLGMSIEEGWLEQQQKQGQGKGEEGENEKRGSNETSLDGKGEAGAEGEDKIVTWCHRMRTTRDHAEVPELMEVLGLDGHGRPVEDRERWERALRERKGTGLSLGGRAAAGKTEAQTTA